MAQAVYVSDIGGAEWPAEDMAQEELDRRNDLIDAQGLGDYGFWAWVEDLRK